MLTVFPLCCLLVPTNNLSYFKGICLQECLTEQVCGALRMLQTFCFKTGSWYLENFRALRVPSGSLFAQSPLQFSLMVAVPSYFFWDFFLPHERLIAETDYKDSAKTDRATEQKSHTSVLVFELLYARKKDTIKLLSAV